MTNHKKEVDQFMLTLTHPLKKEIGIVRDIILNSNKEISEHIKWNSPSFVFNGEDRITFNLHTLGSIQLVFHRGANAKDSKDFKFEDSSGLFKWAGKDRALVIFADKEDIMANKAALVKVVTEWCNTP